MAELPTRFRIYPDHFCCGVTHVGSLSADPEALAADLWAFIKRHADDGRGLPAILVATTNHTQKGAQQGLEAVGFVRVSEAYNHKSGNRVFLYIRPVNQKDQVEKPPELKVKPKKPSKPKAKRKKAVPVRVKMEVTKA